LIATVDVADEEQEAFHGERTSYLAACTGEPLPQGNVGPPEQPILSPPLRSSSTPVKSGLISYPSRLPSAKPSQVGCSRN
jgi:hypothetical protein